MVILILLMLAVGLLASLALGSACLIGQALVESQDCPDLDAAESPSAPAWHAGAVKVAR